jgi:hypothetical protein
VSHRLAIALGLSLWVCSAAAPVRAQRVEPVTVEVEGRVSAALGAPMPSRDALLGAALLEAVMEASRRMLAPGVFEADQEKLRQALAPRARGLVVTFRSGPAHQQVSGVEPGTMDYLQPVAATIDARRLRALLATSGWAPLEMTRPSLVLCVSPEGGLDPVQGDAPLEQLRRFVSRELESREFILIESGVRVGAPGCELGALELARALGADIGVELRVGWREQPGAGAPRSAVAEVSVSAQRTGDTSPLALGRFQGVGHHDSPTEALSAALDAVQVQVVDNLALQLTRNWQEIAASVGPIELSLVGVKGLGQVMSVRELLENRLAADQVDLLELGPGTALLRVAAGLSPGALQDRLASAQFDGFSLEPLGAAPGRVELRIRETSTELDQIDTQEPN